MDQSIVLFVGIDVAKDTLDVYVRNNGSRLSVSNDLPGHRKIIECSQCTLHGNGYRQTLESQGKPFKVVITACTRKLLIILNTMVKSHIH